MLVSFLLRESTFSLFDATKTYPRLVGTSASFSPQDLSTALLESASFDIVVEEQIVAQSNSFLEAFAVMLATYYVFNLAYPKELECTLSFIQKYILDIGDTTKTAARVSGLINKLKKLS